VEVEEALSQLVATVVQVAVVAVTKAEVLALQVVQEPLDKVAMVVQAQQTAQHIVLEVVEEVLVVAVV
jgi:hypothetical protein